MVSLASLVSAVRSAVEAELAAKRINTGTSVLRVDLWLMIAHTKLGTNAYKLFKFIHSNVLLAWPTAVQQFCLLPDL